MNTDAGISLVDRYLDDICPPEDATALALAVEEDTELLALLCEYSYLEASLQEHLATPGERRMPQPRVVSFWHRHRAGLCVAAGAAACLVLWFLFSIRGPVRESSPRNHPNLIVHRFAGEDGHRAALPAAPKVTVKGGTLRRGEFRDLPDKVTRALTWWTSTSVSNNGDHLSGIPTETGIVGPLRLPDDFFGEPEGRALVGTPGDPDEALAYGLRSAGVTFPEGATARWINAEQTAFEAVNSEENLARISRMTGDLANFGPSRLSILRYLWRIPSGEEVPAAILQEKILTTQETEELLKGHTFDSQDIVSVQADPGPPSESQISCPLYSRSSPFDWIQAGGVATFKPYGQLQMRQWRVGDVIFIAGLTGPPLPAILRTPVYQWNPDLEFELTLKDGESAVLHLGQKRDGATWILMIRAGL
jgi:hypothetical protein